MQGFAVVQVVQVVELGDGVILSGGPCASGVSDADAWLHGDITSFPFLSLYVSKYINSARSVSVTSSGVKITLI